MNSKSPLISWSRTIFENWKTIYNTRVTEFRYRRQLLQVDPHAVTKRCVFGFHNRVYHHAVLVDVALGDFSYVSEFSCLYRVTAGKFCAIGPNVLINPGKHPTRDFVSIHPIFYSHTNSACRLPFTDRNYFAEHGSVKIGHDVWLGANAVILDDVAISDGAIIGAGSVVNADVPPYAVVAGIPAKLVRYRFDRKQIEFLENFKWWDKDREWLLQNFRKFHRVEDLMAFADEALSNEAVSG